MFNTRKCELCKTNLKKDEHFAEIRLQTADGISEYNVCQVCAFILDKSAEVMRKGLSKDGDEPI